jgi:uncharacterized BrkB/YihY/UPF0761 family membrane protein
MIILNNFIKGKLFSVLFLLVVLLLFIFVFVLKGSVQHKLRWVESGVIRRVWASYRDAGNYFVVVGGLHLVFNFFPFLFSTGQIMGKFWKNR